MEHLNCIISGGCFVIAIICIIKSINLRNKIKKENDLNKPDEPIIKSIRNKYDLDLSKLYNKEKIIEIGTIIYLYVSALSIILKCPTDIYKNTKNPYKKFLCNMALIKKMQRENNYMNCENIDTARCTLQLQKDLEYEELKILGTMYNNLVGDYNKDINFYLGKMPGWDSLLDCSDEEKIAILKQDAIALSRLQKYDRYDYMHDRLSLLYGAIYLYYKEKSIAPTYNYNKLKSRFNQLVLKAYGFVVNTKIG